MSIFLPVHTLHAVHNSVRQLASTNLLSPSGSLTSDTATILLLKHICPPLNEQKVLLRVASTATARTWWSLSPILPSYRSVSIQHLDLCPLPMACSVGFHHKSDLLTRHHCVNAVVCMGLGKIWQLGRWGEDRQVGTKHAHTTHVIMSYRYRQRNCA